MSGASRYAWAVLEGRAGGSASGLLSDSLPHLAGLALTVVAVLGPSGVWERRTPYP